jgi:multidrug efflux pump subunit AcrB
MFWIVGIALIVSWVVAVAFTPYLGVKMLPNIKQVEGGHEAIYNTRNYNRFRQVLGRVIARKWLVASAVVGAFVLAVVGMGLVKKQFFPTSDRPEVLVEVQMPYGTSIQQTSAATAKVEAWLAKQKEAKVVTSYIGQGAPRFFLAMSPELPDPSFAKIVVLTGNEKEREALKSGCARQQPTAGAGGAGARHPDRVRPAFAISCGLPRDGARPGQAAQIATQVDDVMRASPMMRTVNTDWGRVFPPCTSRSIRIGSKPWG